MAIERSIWIYWFCCAVVAILVVAKRSLADRLLSPASAEDRQGYFATVLLGWAVTLAAAGLYVLLTVRQEPGRYQFIDLAAFATLNGILEQFMFIFWFLIGCWLGQLWFAQLKLQNALLCIFVAGYFSFTLYSGLIHALFWLAVLPKHQPSSAIIYVLSLMSAVWMWLLWRYRAVPTIIAMHIALDFIAIGHLHCC